MIERITVVQYCTRCPLFIKGAYGHGTSDPDECGHPLFGTPHRTYSAVITLQDMHDKRFPDLCPLKDHEVRETIIREKEKKPIKVNPL